MHELPLGLTVTQTRDKLIRLLREQPTSDLIPELVTSLEQSNQRI